MFSKSMESSLPRSMLAAFQEHIQLASSKCGSLMEQLNIVRKKVEGEEAMMDVSESVSYNMEDVSKKCGLHTEEPDIMGCIDEQGLGDNLCVLQSTNKWNCDENKSSVKKKTDSQHSHVSAKEEQVALLASETCVAVEQKKCLVESVNITHPQSSQVNYDNEEKISGKSDLNILLNRDSKFLSQEVFSEDDSTSSCSSNEDYQESGEKQNLYEALIQRVKDNEEKKIPQKSRSSSENSSSTIIKSIKSEKSSKKQLSDGTINVDKFDKKYGAIDSLTGVDFFLPTSVNEKFQDMFYEDSCDEEQDKNKIISFGNMINGKQKQNLGVEQTSGKKTNNTPNLQNLETNTKYLETERYPLSLEIQNDVQVFNAEQSTKRNSCDTSSIRTQKSKIVNNSPFIISEKVHGPELNFIKKYTSVPAKHEAKRTCGRKETKSKKPTIVNPKTKARCLIREANIKRVSEKVKPETPYIFNQTPNVEKFSNNKEGIDGNNKMKLKKTSVMLPKPKNYTKKIKNETMNTNAPLIKENDKTKPIDTVNIDREAADDSLIVMEKVKNDKLNNFHSKKLISKKNNIKKLEKPDNSPANQLQISKNHISLEKEQYNSLSTVVSKPEPVSKTSSYKTAQYTKAAVKEFPTELSCANEETRTAILNSKNTKENITSCNSVQRSQVNGELIKMKSVKSKKDNKLGSIKSQPLDNCYKMKNHKEKFKRTHNLSTETIYTQNINDMKTLTTSFPFILGQSTSKTYNVRAAIQQTMSMIAKSPAETLRRSSFSDMLNVSSKGSTQRSYSSYNSDRKVCPACVLRVDEEEDELDDTPMDPWDTEYHSKRFIRCTCMPRNTVNFKTVMNQLLQETSSSPQSENFQDPELINGGESRVNNSFFRRNNNIYKLSKLLHVLLRIRDLLVT